MRSITTFEENGVERQYSSRSMTDAIKNYKKSCHICYTHGMHIDCDRCHIKGAHLVVMDTFEYLNYNKTSK